jgi:hypothetical protein
MSSIKCPTCGFVRFAIEEHCKRCSAASDQNQTRLSRPKTGAWRDRWWLVKHLEVPLDETCIKCGETKDVSRKPVRIEALSAWSFLTHLVGIHVFRWLQFEIPLCRRHRYGMDKLVVGMMVAGALISLLGIAAIREFVILSLTLLGAGFLTMATGFILYLIRKERVSVWRYKHPYVWLWGVHRSYLERLPNWSSKA